VLCVLGIAIYLVLARIFGVRELVEIERILVRRFPVSALMPIHANSSHRP
jgi:hypothetical protein